MSDLLIALVMFLSGMAWGWYICSQRYANAIAEILKRAGVTDDQLQSVVNELRQELPQDHEDALPRVECRIEQHGGQFYAYRSDNDEFLGQGADKDSLIKAIYEKTKSNFVMVLSQEQGEKLLQKNNG
jgi:hypothetical protein